MQRLDSTYQYEQIPSRRPPCSVGAAPARQRDVLDRPRTIETLKLTHLFGTTADHHLFQSDRRGSRRSSTARRRRLSAGVYRTRRALRADPLPADSGSLVGGELAYWTGQRDTFVQLFVRLRHGLAAYDPLAVPHDVRERHDDRAGSTETLVALGGNYELRLFGVLVGGYLRSFRDGDPSPTSTQKYDEGTLAVARRSSSASAGASRSRGATRSALRRHRPRTPTAARRDRVARRGHPVLLAVGPRLVQAAAAPAHLRHHRAQPGDARALPGRGRLLAADVEHFIGIGAEWWFNSIIVPREEAMSSHATLLLRPALFLAALAGRSRPSRRASRSPRRQQPIARHPRPGLARRGHLPGHHRPLRRRRREQRLQRRARLAQPLPGRATGTGSRTTSTTCRRSA